MLKKKIFRVKTNNLLKRYKESITILKSYIFFSNYLLESNLLFFFKKL